jgi:hypothetical protein
MLGSILLDFINSFFVNLEFAENADVSPVYKKGLKSAAENYRPISLTSVCCKILEHIIARNIMQHAKKTTFYIHLIS